MKKGLFLTLAVLFLFATSVLGADIELAKKSTLETILKRGELWVGAMKHGTPAGGIISRRR